MTNIKTVVIIPARMAATRFPGKPLANILNLPMIEHVRRRVVLCTSVDDVYVATCDEEIKAVVQSYGGKVIMTADTHERCSDRVEEAATHLDADIVVNVQGDEPVIFPESVDDVVKPFITNNGVLCSTLVYPINDRDELTNPNIVKAAVNNKNQVMYLTRAAIPYFKASADCPLYKESGIRAFRRDFLHQYSRLSPTPLETVESIDMLRILEHGYELIAVVTPHVTLGVDIPEDIALVEKVLREDDTQRNLYERILSL